MTFTDAFNLYRNMGKTQKCTFIFCADHGIAEMNVSAYPKTTTAGMVKNYLVDHGAAANAFAKFAKSELYIVDVGVDEDLSHLPGIVDRKIARGTKNFAKSKAMTRAQARQSIKIGKDLAEEAIKAGCNCFLIGEMGIANTTTAAAITCASLLLYAEDITGRGSNISDERLKRKIEIVQNAVEKHDPDPDDPIDILSKVGGFEFGAMAGVILAAAKHKKIVILDGFNTTAAAMLAYKTNPDCANYLIGSHLSEEPGQLPLLYEMNILPFFKLDIALGEAVGSSILVKIFDRLSFIFNRHTDPEYLAFINKALEDNEIFEDGKGFTIDGEEIELSEEGIRIGDLKFDRESVEALMAIREMMENDPDFMDDDDDDDDFGTMNFDLKFGGGRLTGKSEGDRKDMPPDYDLEVRVMDEDPEIVAATDRTFNFYLQTMPQLNHKAMEACKNHIDNLTKPHRSLGLLEEIAVQIAGISGDDIPADNLNHAALGFADKKNCPNAGTDNYDEDGVTMIFGTTARSFLMDAYLGVIDPNGDPTAAFDFGRALAEEISFDTPIIALGDVNDFDKDKTHAIFEKKLLTKDDKLKYEPEEFLAKIPKKYRCMASAVVGAIIAAAHNSTLVVTDCGAVDIIARYVEKICPAVRPYILHASKLFNCDFKPAYPIGFDIEIACAGIEIVEAALCMVNEMKTFADAKVDVAIDGAGFGIQKN